MLRNFSSVVVIKILARSKLELEDDLRWPLSTINPCIKILTERKQFQKSYQNEHVAFFAVI